MEVKKYNFIKWSGTFIIIFVSIITAYKLTMSNQILEDVYYRFNLPEFTYRLKDEKSLRISLGLGVKKEDKAMELSKQQEKIIRIISEYISNNVYSKEIQEQKDLYNVKSNILNILNKNGIPVEYLVFNTYPHLY